MPCLPAAGQGKPRVQLGKGKGFWTCTSCWPPWSWVADLVCMRSEGGHWRVTIDDHCSLLIEQQLGRTRPMGADHAFPVMPVRIMDGHGGRKRRSSRITGYITYVGVSAGVPP